MREDLLEAQACIDWAVSKLPLFKAEIDSWLADNVYVAIEDLEPSSTKNFVVVHKRSEFPLFFNVEFGAYLNTIRSSLDILFVAVARRHQIPNAERSNFPVAGSQIDWASGSYKGNEFVDGLPATERTLIASTKPYQGGNDRLWLLHQLDIKRKHRRLLEVILRPIAFTAPPDFPGDAFTPKFDGWIVSANDKTLLGFLEKGVYGAAENLEVKQIIAINEPNFIQHAPVIDTIYDFANLAKSIVALFDY